MTLPGSRAPAPAGIVSRPLATAAKAADGGCRKPSLLSPGCRAARGCVCYLPPPSLPPRHSLPRQQLGEAVRGEETGRITPHIPCKAAPVLPWPCHLLPGWAWGLPGSLGSRARRGAGTRGGSWPGAGQEWDPELTSTECTTHSPPTLGCMNYYLPLTEKEIKAQKIRVIIA